MPVWHGWYQLHEREHRMFTTLAQNGNAGGAAAGLFILVIYLAIIVLVVAGMWKMFTKAGQPGWGALIPFYNGFLFTQNCWPSSVVVNSVLHPDCVAHCVDCTCHGYREVVWPRDWDCHRAVFLVLYLYPDSWVWGCRVPRSVRGLIWYGSQTTAAVPHVG